MNLSPLVQRTGYWISTSWQYISDRIAILPLFISVAALVVSSSISVAALVVSSWHYSAVVRHHRLSVRPHVVITFTLEGSGEKNGIYIANPGLGPAIMKALSVEVGGKSYDAMDKRVWKNVFRDLTIVPGCLRQGWAQSGNALKAGEELALLTVTRANPPVVDGRECPTELLKFLKTEGLKVRMQYESMYGEPHEAIGESWIDSDTISDIATAKIQQVAPQLAEQLQSMVEQLTQIGDQMQQSYANYTKHMAALAELTLLHELYGDWWLWKRDSPMNPQD